MGQPAADADQFWAAVAARGWGSADTDVFSNEELLELASGLGPVLVSQSGPDPLISTIPSPQPGDDDVLFHTEDTLDGERVAWVVLQCTAALGLSGGGTALASADAIVEQLSSEELGLAEDAIGTLTLLGLPRVWRLLTRRPEGGWSVDIPGATRQPGGAPRGFGELLIPAADHRAIADRLEAIAAEVAQRVQWAPGRLLVFDNRKYLHARLPVEAGTRTLRRVLVGPLPSGAPDSRVV